MLLKTFNKIYDYRCGYSFFNSKIAIISSSIILLFFFVLFLLEIVAPYNPFDPASFSLMDAFTPPSWSEDGSQALFLEQISKEEICFLQ